MGFKFQLTHQLKNMLFLFAFNIPQAEFTSMLWIIILHENKSLTRKPHSRWYREMLPYPVTANLIQFALHLVQIPNFAIDKSPLDCNRVFFMLNGWCDTGGYSSCHIGQLHRVLFFFFTTLVQLCSDVWSSHSSITQAGDSDEIVLCRGKTGKQ